MYNLCVCRVDTCHHPTIRYVHPTTIGGSVWQRKSERRPPKRRESRQPLRLASARADVARPPRRLASARPPIRRRAKKKVAKPAKGSAKKKAAKASPPRKKTAKVEEVSQPEPELDLASDNE